LGRSRPWAGDLSSLAADPAPATESSFGAPHQRRGLLPG